ncbi:MAG: MarR family transcriptional regulator [Deltaproteobacteria bacterium]|nr:MarR family transcriptional regulator [Deltaproteobacteria bacterium]
MKTDDRLIYLLFMAQQKLRTYINNALFEGDIKTTLSQTGILFLLRQEDGQSMTQLSNALDIDNSTLTGLIDRMERSRYVVRRPGDSDRRAFRISITPKGLEESNRARPLIRKINEEIKSAFSQEEIEIFKRVLRGLLEKFGKSGRKRTRREKGDPRRHLLRKHNY